MKCRRHSEIFRISPGKVHESNPPAGVKDPRCNPGRGGLGRGDWLRRDFQERELPRFFHATHAGGHFHHARIAADECGHRIPKVTDGGRLHREGPAGPVPGAISAGAGHTGQGPHRAPIFHDLGITRTASPRVRAGTQDHLGGMGNGRTAGLPGQTLPVQPDDALFQPGPQ